MTKNKQLMYTCRYIKLHKNAQRHITDKNEGRMEVPPWNGQQQMGLGG